MNLAIVRKCQINELRKCECVFKLANAILVATVPEGCSDVGTLPGRKSQGFYISLVRIPCAHSHASRPLQLRSVGTESFERQYLWKHVRSLCPQPPTPTSFAFFEYWFSIRIRVCGAVFHMRLNDVGWPYMCASRKQYPRTAHVYTSTSPSARA